MDEKKLTTTEAARIAGVHPQTMRAWVRDGIVPAERITSSLYLIRESDVRKLKRPHPFRRPVLS